MKLFFMLLVATVLAFAVVVTLIRGWSTKDFFESDAPCIRYPNSTVEPCERRNFWFVRVYPESMAHPFGPPKPIDVEARLRRMWERSDGFTTPQIIMRGVVIPGSSRCVESRAANLGSSFLIYGDDSDRYDEVCFVDLAVREYIVGDGPPRLPVVVGWRPGVSTLVQGYGSDRYYDAVAKRIADVMEGIEFVFDLRQPTDMAWGEWQMGDVWDVQRLSDGTVVGQNERAGDVWDPTGLEYPLADLQDQMRKAHLKLSKEFNGRIGVSPTNPELIAFASRDNLLRQLRERGAYDLPGVTPIAAPRIDE